jgi:hypothetical protein
MISLRRPWGAPCRSGPWCACKWAHPCEWAINQAFEIDHYQPLPFIVDSFDHLFSLVDELERWMREGKLNNVAPGEPSVNERDLRSFLNPP